MPTQQGDLSLLSDPVAQQLLQSPIPARLSYVWTDGTPRVVPIGYHWNGREFVFCTSPEAPKLEAIDDGTRVALSIDSDRYPWKVLLVRGSTRTDVVDGLAPEYEQLAVKMLGPEGARAWTENMRPMMAQMVRIFVKPDWVGILDFETRFPGYVERAMEKAQAGSG
jgi:nitroimidazol reductase NimA-like FMN-containing flavoprotein (pyridoxamine 5'-phosphate oxidase superfamily)